MDSLPAEIKLDIAELLDPPSCFNFALGCKTHWMQCRSTTEKHARLFAFWRTLDFDDPKYKQEYILKRILDDPRLGWYVRELNIPDRHCDFPTMSALLLALLDDDIHLSTFAELYEKDRLLCIGELSEKDQLLCIEMEKLDVAAKVVEALPQYHKEPVRIEEAISILVHYLPQLRVFKFRKDRMFHEMMPAVVRGYDLEDPFLVPFLPFQNLTTVAAMNGNGSDRRGYAHAEWCADYICIPSLKSFVARNLGDSLDDHYMEGYPKSNVTELVLDHCLFSGEALVSILGHIKALKRFTYINGNKGVRVYYRPLPIIDERRLMEPVRVLGALLAYAGHSLEHLYIAGQDSESFSEQIEMAEIAKPENCKDVSLHGFKKLKTLRCDYRLLLPPQGWRLDPPIPFQDPSYEFDFSTILPESLEALHFEVPNQNSSYEFDFCTILPESLEALHFEVPNGGMGGAPPLESKWHIIMQQLINNVEGNPLTPKLRSIYIEQELSGFRMQTETGRPLPEIQDNPLWAHLGLDPRKAEEIRQRRWGR